MILEHALLQVLPGKEAAFEAALAEAKPVISASPGFRGIEVRRDCETPGHYLLIVRWDSIADHREGFRKSDRYQQWRELLHQFYDPMPSVAYFGDVL